MQVLAHTVIKEDRLAGLKKTVSLVKRFTIESTQCLTVTVDRNVTIKNFKLDEEWEAETLYAKTVADLREKYK
jgi:hypothetical protein